MNFFYRWLGRKINEADNDVQYVNEARVKPARLTTRSKAVYEHEGLAGDPVNFKMFKASGGWVIEFKKYDHKSDSVDTSLYVVNNDEDIGKSLSHIITMEALKH